AAEQEFAEKGIYGSRIDEIARQAGINKRMIYEYFGSKEELYKTVLKTVYGRLSSKETVLLSEDISCTDAIKNIIGLYFDFLRANPTYVNMILWENLNRGRYIQDIDFKFIKDPTLDLLRKIIGKGKQQGIFKAELDVEQIIISLLTYTFSYFSNRYTLSKLLGRKLDDEENIKNRIANVTEMFLSYMCQKGRDERAEIRDQKSESRGRRVKNGGQCPDRGLIT
ncbi:MAG: TetR/AcrR family transcriptional regulator, partial [Ruminiclostridium sp.]|nr:TetR/AcrR family transcriptional regulator [Ruminiclostridium sp.]